MALLLYILIYLPYDSLLCPVSEDSNLFSSDTNDSLNKVPYQCQSQCFGFKGKVDWRVAKRILNVLYLNGPLKRTNLAMKAGINYSTLLRYMTWRLELDWICYDYNNGIKLSQFGIQIYRRLNKNGYYE